MMKYFRFFCLVSLIFLAFQTKAQYVPQTAAGYQFKGILADTLNSPVGCGSPVGRVNLIYKRSAFYTDSCNHRVYFYDPHRSAWDTLATAFGSGSDGSLTFEDVLNNGPDLTDNHISNGGANDFYWQNYGTYTIDAQTLAVPYLATPVYNTDYFLAADQFGNLVSKQIQFPTDSSGQVDITHDFQRSLDDGNQLRHDDTVKGDSYAFLWDKVHHFSVMSGATFEFPYGNHSQIFLDSLSSYYYSQDTTGRSQVWASPQYAQIESANSDGDNSSISAWSNGGAMMKGSLADTLDAPVINFAQFHNADSSQNQINIDGNGNFYWTNKGGGTGDVVSTGDVTWSVLDILNAPPGTPVSGDTYLVGTSGTGAWSGHNNEIASWNGSSWDFNTATTGDLLYNDDFNNSGDNGVYKFNGTSWVRIGKLPWLVGLNRGLTNPKFGTFNNTGLEIYTNNTQRIGVSNTGAIKFNAYGSGTNTGTATHNLAVDASGNVIETTGGSSTDTVNVANPISQGLDTTHWVDATPYINAAINAYRFSVGKLKLYLPHADYYISVSALRSGSQTNHQGIQAIDNLEIYGDGVGKTRLHAIGNTTGDTSNTNWYPVINGMYRSNVKVHDLSIDGNQDSIAIYNSDPYVNPTGHNDSSKHYSVQGIYFKDGDNNQVYNVGVDSSQGFGIDFYNVTRGYVRNSKFRFNGNGAIGFTGRDDSKITTGGAYDNICDSNNSDNIRVVSCGEGIAIVHNQLSNAKNVTSSNAFAGLWVDRTRGVYAAYNKVFGNSGYGLDFGGGDSSTTGGARMEYNNIYQNGNGAIVSLGNSVIHGNYLHDNGKSPAGVTDTHSNYNPAAIVVSASPNMTITDNIAYDSVSGTQTYFIKKWGGSPAPAFGFMGSVVSNNRIKAVADTAHAYDGNNGRNSILNNVITNSSGTLVLPAAANTVWTVNSNGIPNWATVPAGTPTLTATQIAYGDASNNMTSDANMTWTSGSKLMTLTNAGIANAATKSLLLTNTTAADVSTHQYSPVFNLHGNEWKTTATAASQPIDVFMQMRGIQSTANPIAEFNLWVAPNNFSAQNTLTIASNGVATLFTPSGAATLNVNGSMRIGNASSTNSGTLATSILLLNTSNVNSTSTLSIINSAGGLTATSNNTIAGTSMNPQMAATAPGTSSQWVGGNFSMQANGSTNYTTAPASVGGLKGSASYGNNGTAVVFPLGIGVQGDINLRTGVTKDLTTGYGLYATLSSAGATPTGKVVNYTGVRIDSVDNNFYSTTNIGIQQDGTNAVNILDGATKIGDAGSFAPVASAVLELTSTTKGFLAPRMTNTQRDAISSPAEGLLIYSTTDHAYEYYNGTAWKQITTL